MTDLILFREDFVPTRPTILSKEEFLHLSALRRKDLPSLIEIRDGLGKIHYFQYEPKSKELIFIKTDSFPIKIKTNQDSNCSSQRKSVGLFLKGYGDGNNRC